MPKPSSGSGSSTPFIPASGSQPITTTTGAPHTSVSPPPSDPQSPSGRATSQSSVGASQPLSSSQSSSQHKTAGDKPAKGGRESRGEQFEVVPAPAMLEGERPAPTSGPLFDLIRARVKALEMGRCEEEH